MEMDIEFMENIAKGEKVGNEEEGHTYRD